MTRAGMPEPAGKDTPVMSGGSTLFIRASGVATLLAGLILVAGWVTAAADSLITAGVEPSDDYRKGL
jgi:hypothetical protein